ncbi:MAG TPA: glycosyltransferase family 1 protein [Blastocatellia bacterium]|nr:glycosyltransferase family 1 protein [Blastocatellia bacterium]
MKDSKKSLREFVSKSGKLTYANADGEGRRQTASDIPTVSRFPVSAHSLDYHAPDLVCFSHLRWDFVYQRPQHLLSRCAQDRRVFFVEEPIFEDTLPRLDISQRDCGVWVAVPRLPHGMSEGEAAAAQQSLLIDDLFLGFGVNEYILWYYTPMALAFTQHLEPLAVVYDCMDELSAFKYAPPSLREREQELFKRADLVFTGGHSLYEAKRHLHPNIYPFPSSIDGAHFRQARQIKKDPPDQAAIPRPRLGYCGVIDERMDLELIDGIAKARPDWHLVMVGPVVKIDPADLPKRENIHYLGGKQYKELPAYLAGWDIAMLPFARNESTQFISPTKTPEYLAAGVPVVSTSIRDVVRPYGQQGLVKIADTVEGFIAAAESLISKSFEKSSWLRRVDEVLAYNSWDRTWARMMQMLNLIISSRYPALLTPTLRPPTAGRQPLHSTASSSTTGD